MAWNMRMSTKIFGGLAVALVLTGAGLTAWRAAAPTEKAEQATDSARFAAAGAGREAEGNVAVSASAIREAAEAIHRDQEEEYAQLMAVQDRVASASREHLLWIVGVTDLVANKDRKTLAVEKDGAKCRFGQWLAGPEFETQIKAAGAEFRAVLEVVREDHAALHASAAEVEKARRVQGGADTSAQVFAEKTQPISERLIAGIEKMEKALIARRADKLAKMLDGHKLTSLALSCTRAGREFLLHNGEEHAKEVNDITDRIVALSRDIETRFKQEENKALARRVAEAAQAYKRVFARIVAEAREQEQTGKTMSCPAAPNRDGAARTAEAPGHNVWVAVSSSRLVIVAGALAGIAVGVLWALLRAHRAGRPSLGRTEILPAPSEQVPSPHRRAAELERRPADVAGTAAALSRWPAPKCRGRLGRLPP